MWSVTTLVLRLFTARLLVQPLFIHLRQFCTSWTDDSMRHTDRLYDTIQLYCQFTRNFILHPQPAPIKKSTHKLDIQSHFNKQE